MVDAVEVEPVVDAVEVEPVVDAVEVEPVVDAVEVEPVVDAVEVEPGSMAEHMGSVDDHVPVSRPLMAVKSNESSMALPGGVRLDGVGGALVLPGGAVLLLPGAGAGDGSPAGVDDAARIADLPNTWDAASNGSPSIVMNDADGSVALPGGVRLDGVGGALVLPGGAVLLLAGAGGAGDTGSDFGNGAHYGVQPLVVNRTEDAADWPGRAPFACNDEEVSPDRSDQAQAKVSGQEDER